MSTLALPYKAIVLIGSGNGPMASHLLEYQTLAQCERAIQSIKQWAGRFEIIPLYKEPTP